MKGGTRRTLLPSVSGAALGAVVSALLAIAAVGLVAFGISLIYVPAGVIAAGLGAAVLQWQFFGGS